jgi:agmatinase
MKLPLLEPRETDLKAAGANVAFFGFPWDATVIGRTGTSFGPKSIREVSYEVTPYNASTGVDLTEHYTMVDCGDVPVIPGNPEATMKQAQDVFLEILRAGALPVMIGGDHSTTIAGTRAYAQMVRKPGLIQVDFHFDVSPDYWGEEINHCCTIARAMDAGFSPENIVIIGPGGWANWKTDPQFVREHGITLFSIDDVIEQGATEIAKRAVEIATNGTDGLYLTVDIDCLDITYAPGTGTPAIGGLTYRELKDIVSVVSRSGLGALDLVEVSPAWDSNGITSRVACNLLLEALAANIDSL